MLVKNNLIATVVMVMLLATVVFAQERTMVTIGGTWWNAAYSYENEDGEKLADIGSGNSIGPNINISHGKVNFGASLLFGSFPVDSYSIYGEAFENEIDMSRSDLNFTLGYRLHRYINVFIGAKYIKWALTMDDYNLEVSESGMMYGLGLSAVVPIGSEGLYAFGSLAGMGGTLTYDLSFEDDESEQSTNLGDVSAALAAINLGLGYRFSGGLGINVGYRADLFSEEAESDNNSENSEDEASNIRVQGLIVTASYSF